MDLKSMWNKTISVLKMLSIEPYLLFLTFGYFVRSTTFQDLLLNRSCRILLHYPDSVCTKLTEDEHRLVRAEAMTYGVNMNTGCLMLGTIPALVVSTFLGPWSDKYGRKYTLVVSTTGILIDAILSLIFTVNMSMSPFWFLLSSLFSGIGGGLIVSISCVYSYMSHATDEKSRPTRFAILEFFFIMATPLGTIIGGKVFAAGSYSAVMGLGIGSFILALLWLLFMVKESNEARIGKTRKELIQDLFKIDNLTQSYRTAVMPRQGNLRLQIWLLIIASVLIRMITIGSGTIMYYYANLVFNWDVTEYADSTTAFHFLNAIATLAIVPLFNLKFFLHEAAVGLIGSMSLMAKSVVLAVAVKPALIYYGMFCGLLSSCEGIAIRSRMSKLVSKTELGRIFSLIATCEALSPVIGTLIMSQLFNIGKHTYPGLPFAVSAVSVIPVFAVFWWMLRLPTTSVGSYIEMEVPAHELENVANKPERSLTRESQEFKEIPLNDKEIKGKY